MVRLERISIKRNEGIESEDVRYYDIDKFLRYSDGLYIETWKIRKDRNTDIIISETYYEDTREKVSD